MMVLFRDRVEAGQALAKELDEYSNRSDVVVLALPRGGVPVAYEVAVKLHAHMDVFLVRKIGAPGHEEFAIGAIASGGIRYLNEEVIHQLRIPQDSIDATIEREKQELERRESAYRQGECKADLAGRTVILVDDGLATGSTMHAAALAAKERNPARVVIAVPVAPYSTCERLREEVDELVCLRTPEPFYAVGQWYEDFAQTTDDEVRALLERARRLHDVSIH
jgi:putative phosphoribosyl transferase